MIPGQRVPAPPSTAVRGVARRRARPHRHPAADQGGPVPWSRLRRVLAVRPDNLGDVVMLTPALRALRRALPVEARIDLLASPAGAAARQLLPDVDGMLVVSPSWQDASGRAEADPVRAAWREHALVKMVAARDYDAMLVFTSARQSPWPAAHVGMLAGIGVRAVHSTEFGGAVATHWVTPPSERTHQVDRCLHLLGALGVPDAGRELDLRVPPEAEVAATAALGRAGLPPGAPFALLAPGASCATRRYPADRFAAVARHLAEAGLPTVVTGSHREDALVARVVSEAGHPGVRPLEQVGVPVLAAVVASARVVLCNNSGCMHLADALGTPVVVAYSGSERLGDMRPRGVPAALLRRSVPCSPCRQFRCPYALECLDIGPDELAVEALRLVGDARDERDGRGEREPEPVSAGEGRSG
ncbi:ADP-heptose:LPS heptosyltransferase [Streptoalloteichus tenebrarius]|uniref:ADP-heptose:LPS heptosyltransferase n=1 Tax=Streptoalloteichus tenebrarius (strain ATCC 17920 / DSM 40477 / JCM 4838 / CBS 697.72 / NBRC 16177 / NCIMB 11028 / NRRL B-12390 / A12253. 1 / ISP 5477) TaxID=1933 RepID=A0ABT1HQA2_STRSD|nr:glycosyltransferase family 9 protein [Streptoalloteichus tenebrarius]MCP2257696.1 ADP-heptose:LPS heptosyltransferase [Streptoalloteichus tenebrarius]BFE99953.1 glycosyltransferase family 9 protein [Streptoalloteichus tenebrarius]